MGNADQPLIVGIGGTARPGSSTETAIGYALARAEELGARTRFFAGSFLCGLPHYDPETRQRSESERVFIEAIRAADGLIIGSPGYHGGVSGVVKNAIDLIEETAKDARVYLSGRAVGLVVTAYGWQATGSTLASLRSIVHALRGWPTPMGATVNAAGGLLDAQGGFRDPAVPVALKLVAEQVVQFAQWQRRDSVQMPDVKAYANGL